jgi:hypothetical protein
MTAQDILQIVTASALIQCICDIGAHYIVYQKESYQDLLDKLASSQSKLLTAQNKLKTEETTTTVANNNSSTKGSDKSSSNKKSITNVEKHQQLIQRLEEEHNHRLSAVALAHFRPFVFTGVVFLLLMRILGTEHKNKIIAVLPFVPYRFIQRFLSLRGLQINPQWFNVNNVDDTSILIQELLSNVNNTYAVSHAASGKVNSITSIGQICSFTFIYMLTSMSVKYYVNQLLTTPPPKGAESYVTTMMDAPKTQEMVKGATGIDPKIFKTE